MVESGATTTETAEEQDTIAIETSEANLPIKIDHNINWALSDTIPTDTQITTISSKKQVSNSATIRQNVIFRGNVTIKAGAYIVGAAEFRKNVYLQGKKERPIHWSSSDNGINEIGFYTPTFVLGNLNSEHTIFENLLLQGLANHKNTEYSFSYTSFRNSLVDFLHEAGLSLKFMHSELHNTAASIYCHIYDSEASSKHSEDSNIPETSESFKSPSTPRRWTQGPLNLEFYLNDSILNESSIDFSCPESPQSEINSKLIITGNNFFKNRDDSYYFLNRFNDLAGLNTDSPTGSQYTSQNSENVTIQNNYFQFSNRIASKLDPSNWPETIGANLESPNTSAGVE
ncbi:MAG: hypothetical protein R3B45_05605 [Bdellovibrionota bacterium]